MALIPFSAQGEDDQWYLCAVPPPSTQGVVHSPTLPDLTTGTEITFTADQFEVLGSEYRLKGKVKGSRGDQTLSADSLSYDKNTDEASATGNVRYERGSRTLTGDEARINIGKDTGSIKPARFWFSDNHVRGQAESVQFDGVAKARLQDVTFTTCDEGSHDWLLKASYLSLDFENNEGLARHARIRFMSVPIFYFPYLSFPLEGRKTGFLAPTLGDSTNSGSELSVPYYWNISPHRDATLTPRYLSRRGLLLETEFRYLNEHSAGQIEVAYINDDEILGKDRSAVNFVHRGNPALGWSTDLAYRRVSDGDYLNDFGSELATSSVTHLERHANVAVRNDYLQASLLAQDYQTLDDSLTGTDEPYKRLPEFRLNSRDWRGTAGLSLGMSAEAVSFDRSTGVVGNRLDIQPRLSWPWQGDTGFMIPKLTFRHTRYQLDRSNTAYDQNPSRSLPVFSVDSGLFFERERAGSTLAKRQTLEPRLFYLHVPYRDQENLIVDEMGMDRVFDSSLPALSFGQMFRENRFSGADRVGDANQLGSAVTTRFLDDQGHELLSASMGRIFYFKDREVTLPGGVAETESSSDWLGEINSNWTPTFSTRASVQWDPDRKKTARGSANLLYQKDKRRVLRLTYRYEENTIEQSDIALMWPLAPRWNLVGRWLHSIRDDITLESLKGIEYDSCCWTARLVQRIYRVDALDEKENNAIWFQLELKGLTSVGKGIKNLLAHEIVSP